MDVNRSGYYKWRVRAGQPNRYVKDRMVLTELLEKEHEAHRSHGYHRLAHSVRQATGWVFSDNLAHKCCKAAGICSLARRRKYHKPGAEHIRYPNRVNGKWNAKRPLELVVSDMTCFRHKGKLYEWVLFLDTFNNEIITHSLSEAAGSTKPYYRCLDALNRKVGKKSEQTAPTILHTDQGAVYSSRAFAQAHSQYSILRSMSRIATPTDNPIIEALNGWIKEELFLDFNLKYSSNIFDTLSNYVRYFNYDRPAFSLNYKSPVQFKIEQGF